jgi:hypothetical protein
VEWVYTFNKTDRSKHWMEVVEKGKAIASPPHLKNWKRLKNQSVHPILQY